MGILDIFKKKSKIATTEESKKNFFTKNINTQQKTSQKRSVYGLSIEEIKFLEYSAGHDSDISTFSPKYYYEYELDYSKTISYLIDNSYLRIGTAEESLDLYTVQDFKTVLKEIDLPTSGNKDVLIRRLIDSSCNYEEKFTRRKYILTDKGRDIIDRYKFDYNLPKTEQEKLNFQFMEYGKQVQKHLQEGNLGLYACDLYSMSEVYRKEHCYNDQLQVLMESAYIHLSGIGTLESFHFAVSNHFKYTGLHPTVPPAVIRGIESAMKALNMDIPAFRARFKEKIDLTLTPAHIFGVDKSLEIICLYLEGNATKAENEIKKETKKFISQYK